MPNRKIASVPRQSGRQLGLVGDNQSDGRRMSGHLAHVFWAQLLDIVSVPSSSSHLKGLRVGNSELNGQPKK
jgi:hypothetical protein